MTPKVVVFDLGKVLVDFDYSIAYTKIAGAGKVGAADVQHVLENIALLRQYETGLLDRRQFFQEICAATGYRQSLEQFSADFSDIFFEIPEIIALQKRLRQAGVPTFIFSNTNDLAVEHIRRRFPFFGNFDGYIYSYEHGAMKPDGKLYEVVERQTGRSGPEIVYLDDRAENVATGVARGWHAILHETPAASIAALDRLGWPALQT